MLKPGQQDAKSINEMRSPVHAYWDTFGTWHRNAKNPKRNQKFQRPKKLGNTGSTIIMMIVSPVGFRSEVGKHREQFGNSARNNLEWRGTTPKRECLRRPIEKQLKTNYLILSVLLVAVLLRGEGLRWDAASNPRESLSISAPNWPRADIVHGVGSVSCIQSSWVSMVVSSVSVEAPEWWPCWGVTGFPVVFVAFSNFLQVHRRSVKIGVEISKWNPVVFPFSRIVCDIRHVWLPIKLRKEEDCTELCNK